MARLALIFGALLIVVGFVGFAGTGAKTALIPTWVGLTIMLLGVLAMARPSARKHAMHAAAAVGLLGFIAAAMRLIKGFTGEHMPSSAAIASLSAMTVLCGAFVVMCVGSFMSARRRPPIETAGLK